MSMTLFSKRRHLISQNGLLVNISHGFLFQQPLPAVPTAHTLLV